MATRKQAPDVNADVAKQLRKVTETPQQNGEDLISDPQLREAYIALKKWGKERKDAKKRRG